MASGRRRRQRLALQYPKHAWAPEDLLNFIESSVFTKRWAELGLDDEDDLTALQLFIMLHPTGYPIIRATGGLRKLRFSRPQSGSGKSGGLRVCYVYFGEYHIV